MGSTQTIKPHRAHRGTMRADTQHQMSTAHRGQRGGAQPAMHRVRVPHDGREIELVVQVVDQAAAVEKTQIGAPLQINDSWDNLNEATNIRALPEIRASQQQMPRPQEVVNPSPQSRGFVLAPGGRAGKYELREKLGQGTFGYVFTARDMDLDRDVAFKVLNPSHQTNSDIVALFLQEARASARITHPGIVTVVDCGRIPTTIGETAVNVMDLVERERLTNRLMRTGR